MGARHVGWIGLLVGCGGGEPECRAGFTLGDDGLCYEQADPTPPTTNPLEALFDGLPDCAPLAQDGQLDLERLCAGPGCADDPFAALDSAYGGGTCGSIGGGRVECAWAEWGVIGNFLDPDGDGEVEAEQLPTGLFVGATFPGATAQGLGAGISVGCFLDAYGLPTSLEPTEAGGDPWIFWWGFAYGRFYVVDTLDADGAPGGDGIAEYVWLNGPS